VLQEFQQPPYLCYPLDIVLGNTATEQHQIEEVETAEFWPECFRVNGLASVRVKVYDIALGDEDKSIDDLRADHLVDMARERVAQVEKYASSLDVAAMKIDFDQLKLFIAHYATYHSVRRAAKYAGNSVACFRHRRKIDGVFDEMWDVARESWVDKLEEVGMARATADVDVRFSGPSNDMLKFMLKSNSTSHQDVLNVRHGGIEDEPIRIKRTFEVEHLTETVGILHEVLSGST
jgi:hypothetical protein